VDPKVNDEFLKWLQENYGDPKLAPVKATRGKIHDYLAMNWIIQSKVNQKLI
jgi:hypothetical protein